jgi:hypothetical protein
MLEVLTLNELNAAIAAFYSTLNWKSLTDGFKRSKQNLEF